MSAARTETIRLYVAVAGLLTGVLNLLCAVVKLLAALVTAATALLQPKARQPAVSHSAEPSATVMPNPQLVPALIGMGFKPKEVKDAVRSLGPKAQGNELAPLIREALGRLAA